MFTNEDIASLRRGIPLERRAADEIERLSKENERLKAKLREPGPLEQAPKTEDGDFEPHDFMQRADCSSAGAPDPESHEVASASWALRGGQRLPPRR